MSRIKEYYLNNLTEDEIKEMEEEHYFLQEYLWELKELSTSQSEEDMDTHPTYLYDS